MEITNLQKVDLKIQAKYWELEFYRNLALNEQTQCDANRFNEYKKRVDTLIAELNTIIDQA